MRDVESMGHADREYVLRALRGDQAAYAALVDAYQGMVFAIALNITGNYADSEDVVQEAFLRAYHKLRTLSDPSKFASWLYTVAKRVALQVLKERRNIETVAPEQETAKEEVASDAESPAEAYARKELGTILWNEVADLPPKTREAILLYYAEGFSVKRAAEFLGISEAAFKMRLSFGREKLREPLMEKIEGELRSHQPSDRTRNAIIAALPASGVPPVGLLKLAVSKAGSIVAAVSAKHLATIGAAIAVCSIGTLFLVARPPKPSPPQQPTSTSAVQKKGADVRTEKPRNERAFSPKQWVIMGRVYDAGTGEAIQGVQMSAVKTGTEKRCDTLTDVHGEYRFEGVDNGLFTVYCVQTEEYIRPIPDRLSLSVKPGQLLGDADFPLTKGLRVSGKAVDEKGAPVGGARVQSRDAPTTYSSTDGTFLMTGVHPTIALYLSAEKDDMRSDQVGPFGFQQGMLENVVITLCRLGRISGRVVDHAGRPVQHAVVVPKPRSYLTNWGWRTDADGTFTTEPGLLPGSYSLGVSLPGETSYQDLVQVELKSGESIENIVLEVDARKRLSDLQITGRVTDHKGNPLPNAQVSARDSLDSPRYDATSDAHGFYKMSGLLETDYDITATLPSFSTAIIRQVPAGTTNADFCLLPLGEVVGHVVRADTGDPVTDFEVECHDYPRRHDPVRVHDEQGLFRLKDLDVIRASEREPQRVTVRAQGFAPAEQRIQWEPPENAVARVTFSLEPGGQIHGTVTDSSGLPVGAAQIFLGDIPPYNVGGRGEHEMVAQSRPDGTFSIESLPACRHTIFACHPQYPVIGTAVETLSGQVTTVQLVFPQGGIVRGRVTFAGQPLGKVEVTVSNLEGSGSHELRHSPTGFTEQTGVYEIPNVLPGECVVSAAVMRQYHEGLPDAYGAISMSDAKRVTVRLGAATVADFAFPKGTAEIEGVVTRDGHPVYRASVYMGENRAWRDGQVRYEADTDQNGYYHLKGLPACIMTLKVILHYPYSGQQPLEGPTVQTREGEVTRCDIELAKSQEAH